MQDYEYTIENGTLYCLQTRNGKMNATARVRTSVEMANEGLIDREQALRDMLLYVENGITTFDCADIYTGVESLIGEFLSRHRGAMRSGSLPQVQVHTKYVPDLSTLSTITRRDVQATVDRSLDRLGVDCLDLVQFHWWDYDVPGYVEAALHLDALRDAGKIRHIGVTNFDVARLAELRGHDPTPETSS